jgi:hypothetical protein
VISRPRKRLAHLFLTVALSLTAAGAVDRPSIAVVDLDDRKVHPFSARDAIAHAFIFVRSDCPISNAYAPQIQRLHDQFAPRRVQLWLVYVDPSESAATIRRHMKDFRLDCPAVRDLQHALVNRAQAKVTPEAAVFLGTGEKIYSGRIDDRFTTLGRQKERATTDELEGAITAALTGKEPPRKTVPAVGCPIADLQ